MIIYIIIILIFIFIFIFSIIITIKTKNQYKQTCKDGTIGNGPSLDNLLLKNNNNKLKNYSSQASIVPTLISTSPHQFQWPASSFSADAYNGGSATSGTIFSQMTRVMLMWDSNNDTVNNVVINSNSDSERRSLTLETTAQRSKFIIQVYLIVVQIFGTTMITMCLLCLIQDSIDWINALISMSYVFIFVVPIQLISYFIPVRDLERF